ncbi:MAG: hypothetical protein H8E55_17050 [Pelagibacterales bacterium]|nr:hypothetical protein [Pelagibacterales bacterium]
MKKSANNVDKRMDSGGPKVLVADSNEHIDLEIMNVLKEMYEEAKQNGYKGTLDQWQKTLSLDELKRIGIKDGGLINMYNAKS